MSIVWTRLLKQAYRRQPLISFVVTVGAVDLLLGGLEGRGSLLVFGLGTIGAAIAYRWWHIQRKQVGDFAQPSVRYLPDHSSRPQLPMLGLSRKDDPTRSR